VIFLPQILSIFCHRCIRNILNSLRSVGNCFSISSSACVRINCYFFSVTTGNPSFIPGTRTTSPTSRFQCFYHPGLVAIWNLVRCLDEIGRQYLIVSHQFVRLGLSFGLGIHFWTLLLLLASIGHVYNNQIPHYGCCCDIFVRKFDAGENCRKTTQKQQLKMTHGFCSGVIIY
jgi:hypothetical protein